MSIWSSGGFYTPMCDGCNEELEPEFEWADAKNAMECEGWVYRNGENFCKKCQEKDNHQKRGSPKT